MDSRKVVIRPFITEKSTTLREKENKYIFVVAKSATKSQVKHAVQELFKVNVEDVHTAIMQGKVRRLGAHSGQRPDWKKAIVKVQKGQEIKMVEEA